MSDPWRAWRAILHRSQPRWTRITGKQASFGAAVASLWATTLDMPPMPNRWLLLRLTALSRSAGNSEARFARYPCRSQRMPQRLTLQSADFHLAAFPDSLAK